MKESPGNIRIRGVLLRERGTFTAAGCLCLSASLRWVEQLGRELPLEVDKIVEASIEEARATGQENKRQYNSIDTVPNEGILELNAVVL